MRLFIAILFSLTILQQASSWTYTKNVDIMTDQDRSLVQPDISDVVDFDGFMPAFKCFSDGLNFIVSHSYMGGDSNDEIRVHLRFDNEPMETYRWSLGTGSEVTFADMRDVPHVASKFRASNRVVMRLVDPLDGETLTTIFKLDGFSAELEKMSC